MELWRVRKEYRQLAVRLRRSLAQVTLVDLAEEHVLVMLGLGDRLETELSVLRSARRSARARLRRLRGWLESSGVLKHLPPSLSRRPDELAVAEFAHVLAERGFHEAAALVSHLRRELLHLDGRIDDTRERLQRLSDNSRELFERLRGHVRCAAPLAGAESHG